MRIELPIKGKDCKHIQVSSISYYCYSRSTKTVLTGSARVKIMINLYLHELYTNYLLLQCFDANSYLQINKNHPKFDCPVCNKKVYFSSLVVDSYFLKILGEVQSQPDVDEVLILPDGTYNIVPPKEEKSSDEESYSESAQTKKRKIDQVVTNNALNEPNKRQSKCDLKFVIFRSLKSTN